MAELGGFKPAARSVVAIALLSVTVGLTTSCRGSYQEKVPPAELAVGAEATIVTGPVGIGAAEKDATYVLADVSNNGTADAVVTLEGELFDIAENSIAKLRAETLRVPAGETLLFALVDREIESLKTTAANASANIHKAVRPTSKAGVIVTGVTQSEDESRAVVEGYIENQTGRHVSVMILGAFYDSVGKPMMRRATLYKLDAGGKRSAQFVGPTGSTRGSLFIGEIGP